MKKSQLEIIRSKLFGWKKMTHQIEVWRFLDNKIVFTNGCFDVLHVGHIEYLAKASDLGDILIVGMNTDDSVRRIKGDTRPIYDQEARSLTLASMHFIDAVVLFDEDTPYELIKMIQPDILVKGADYSEDEIVGADIVKAKGGEVVTIDLIPGYSTSETIDKLAR